MAADTPAQQAWFDRNRDRINAKRRAHLKTPRGREQKLRVRLKYEYNITLEEYKTMEQRTGGRCPVCTREPRQRLVVDHCHKTGKVRGLLCHECNLALGKLGDCPSTITRLLEYIQQEGGGNHGA